MRSEGLQLLRARIAVLKRRYLPPLKVTGIYTAAQQDQMRAFRMLVHAEVEAYLEQLATDLQASVARDLSSPRAAGPYVRSLANSAQLAANQAISDNNGVKESDIRKMFEPLGLSDDDFNAIHNLFLSRMSDFGKQRGYVAHQSAISATYALNRQREAAFIDEIMIYLDAFDKTIQRRRLLNSFDRTTR